MSFFNDISASRLRLPTAEEALPGRDVPIPTATHHLLSGRPLHGPYPENLETAYFGMGCFWGVERLFWQVPGVYLTAAGYQGGITPNPTYRETCTGMTGHAETVLVVFDPAIVSYEELLRLFWENHDPTQGMRQGNDVGTTYRSAIFTTSQAQQAQAQASLAAYRAALAGAGHGVVTTQVEPAPVFYFAEEEHQQYLARNPDGYCGLKGTGVACVIPAA